MRNSKLTKVILCAVVASILGVTGIADGHPPIVRGGGGIPGGGFPGGGFPGGHGGDGGNHGGDGGHGGDGDHDGDHHGGYNENVENFV